MNIALPALLAAIIVSAMLHLRADYRRAWRQTYIFKPLTTVLIIVFALTLSPHGNAGAKPLIVGGLIFSLAGDIFLMLPADRFMAGLASFLVAHLLYIAAFAAGGWNLTPIAALPAITIGAVLLWILLPRTGRMRVPVTIYATALLVLLWQSMGRATAVGDAGAWLALAGAAVFVASDATLAINRFVKPFRAAQLVVMSTYVLAQVLIAASI